ncbi:MAG: biotin-dependent carboxyltransferase family protein [Paraburkholderia sp.]|jgi:antagonist of KipI|uniref:5-oxoprolinase subunit C family protein n=1 Tax=Burkholderiaceae TaxID=119060 RepID=UPI0010F5CE68|nr:biotin-dependent carboxyltransferase family protein [Burkholderia sp. 4M9327F10]
MSIEVVKPGALSTFQDLGRTGYQHLGIPVNGVMDERAHRLANALVGNLPSSATLEITLMGPALRFHEEAVIAISGADLGAQLNGQPLAIGQMVAVAQGGELSFGKRSLGMRAYLAVRGGFACEPVMRSASTYTRGGYGGHAGRPLKKGDLLAIGPAARSSKLAKLSQAARSLSTAFDDDVVSAPDAPIRVIPGREWSCFSARAREALNGTPYRISPQSDRMGYRLEGEKLELTAPREVISEAVGFGSIQVPADGQPIILMADRQTTGGYPKIGHVCAVDLPRLAQTMPGETIRLQVVDLGTAQRLAISQERSFAALEQLCQASN